MVLRRSLVVACTALLCACATLLGLDEALPQASVDGGPSSSSSSGGSSSGAASPPDAGIPGDAERPYCAGKSGFCDDFAGGRVQQDPDHWLLSTDAGAVTWQDGGAPQYGFAQIKTDGGTATMHYISTGFDQLSFKLKSDYVGVGIADLVFSFQSVAGCSVAAFLESGFLKISGPPGGTVGELRPGWNDVKLQRTNQQIEIGLNETPPKTLPFSTCNENGSMTFGFNLAGGFQERSIAFDDIWIRTTPASP